MSGPGLQPGEKRPCTKCGTVIIGAVTIQGKVAPIEEVPHRNGNTLLQRHHDGMVHAITFGPEASDKLRRKGVELRHNHFATCPAAEQFRRTTNNEETGT